MTLTTNILRFSDVDNDAPPPRLGVRYTNTKFLPEGGNTVVCHLNPDAPEHEAILDACNRMRALPSADRFLFTPTASLHMTLFNGALETQREMNFWPEWLPLDAPMTEVTRWLLESLREFQPLSRFNVRIESIAPTGLQLCGATAADEQIMRTWRDALCGPFGYRHPDHDNYRFHMTFAYPLAWIPQAIVPVWQEEYQSILSDLQVTVPVIPLNPPAFCTFEDMTHFEEILRFES